MRGVCSILYLFENRGRWCAARLFVFSLFPSQLSYCLLHTNTDLAAVPCLPAARKDDPFQNWLSFTHRLYNERPPEFYRRVKIDGLLNPHEENGVVSRTGAGNQNPSTEMNTSRRDEALPRSRQKGSTISRKLEIHKNACKLRGMVKPTENSALVSPVIPSTIRTRNVEGDIVGVDQHWRRRPTSSVEQTPGADADSRAHNAIIRHPQIRRKRAWEKEDNEVASPLSKRRRSNEGDFQSYPSSEAQTLTIKVELDLFSRRDIGAGYASSKEHPENALTTGKESLLILPPELRDRVYHHILSATRNDPSAGNVTENSTALSILRVNRQINREASRYLLKNREWDLFISDIPDTLEVFDIILPPPSAETSSARHIENLNLVLRKTLLDKEKSKDKETNRLQFPGKEIDGISRVRKKHPLYYLANALNWMPALRKIRIEIEEFKWQENEDDCMEERYSMGPFLKLLRGLWQGPVVQRGTGILGNDGLDADVLYYSRGPSPISLGETNKV